MKKESLPDVSEVVSTSDCTGLIPALPTSEFELKSYGEIVPLPDCEVKK